MKVGSQVLEFLEIKSEEKKYLTLKGSETGEGDAVELLQKRIGMDLLCHILL